MKIGHTIDANGFYTGDVLEGSGITPDVTVICSDGFHKPKWNGLAWVEGGAASLVERRQVVKDKWDTQIEALRDTIRRMDDEAKPAAAITKQKTNLHNLIAQKNTELQGVL